MPQSLAKIYVHLIFSTKNRAPIVPANLLKDLHSYMGGILCDLGCTPIEINTMPDHAHVLFLLCRTHSVGTVVGEIKSGATNWLKVKPPPLNDFHWQNGYGAFSVSQSQVATVREYIQNQELHHRQLSFQDEFRTFLHRYEVEYDERYVWD